MQNVNSVRITMNFAASFFHCSGRLHHRSGRCGDLEGEPSACPTRPCVAFGQWAESEMWANIRGGAQQGTNLFLGLLCPPAWRSPGTTFCGHHYPFLEITGLPCVTGIRIIQSTTLGKLDYWQSWENWDSEKTGLFLKMRKRISRRSWVQIFVGRNSGRYSKDVSLIFFFPPNYPKSTRRTRKKWWHIWSPESQNTKSERGGKKGSQLSWQDEA